MLKKIDFSDGIRSVEIENNFQDVQNQINKERISVAGAGISYGMSCILSNFNLEISKGCLISFVGEEIFIDKTEMEIEKPILIERVDQLLKIDANNRVYLSEIPYSLNRNTTSDNGEIDDSGVIISVSGIVGEDAELPIMNVSQNVITLAGYNGTSLEGTIVNAKYYFTRKRRDIIYIDNDYNIRCLLGTTSSSPSVLDLDEKDYIYKIGYIETNGHTLDAEGIAYASCKFIKEYKSVRNVYTDTNNNLYLCGTPFESISIIHMIEPDNPQVDTMWYDQKVNKLKIWKHTDKFEFVDTLVHESSNPNHHQKFKTVVPYLYNTKQLSVYLNDIRLSSLEFEEGSDLEISEQEKGKPTNEFRIIKKIAKDDVITYKIDRYDGYAEWVAINDSSYLTAQERYIWTPEELSFIEATKEGDNQTFFFHAKDMRNLLYVPNKNCMEVIIDQQVLNSDQFEEITLNDALASQYSKEFKNKLIKYYGYSEDLSLQSIHSDYENIGIGFRLNAKLNKPVYIEAVVNQRINSNPLTKRFQRSATFASDGTITYKTHESRHGEMTYSPPIFTTGVRFRFQESQLEVYLNGKRLDRGIHYIEGTAGSKHLQGTELEDFTVLSSANIQDGDVVSYRIETTIYSYDHVEGLLARFDGAIGDMQQQVKLVTKLANDTKDDVDNYTEEIREKMDTILNIEEGLDLKYMSINKMINADNLNVDIYEGTKNGIINQTYTISKTNQRLDVTSICSVNDYVLIHNITSNNILCRDSDYTLVEEAGRCYLNILSSSVQVNHQIYLSGIKFNRA